MKARIGYQEGQDVRNNVICYMEEHLERFPDKIALSWADPQALSSWEGNPHHRFPHHSISFRKRS